MKRNVKYWVDGQKMDYKHARKMPGFDPRYCTVDYKPEWKERKYDVMYWLEVNLLFWGFEIGLTVLTVYLIVTYMF